MRFSQLAEYLDRLEQTSSRIEITKILADLFKKADANEIDKIVYLILGRLAPSYESIVFNLADRTLIEVIAKSYNKESKEVLKLYKEKGDLGIVAQEIAKNIESKISIREIYDLLRKAAEEEGEGSVERKIKVVSDMLGELDPLSVRFVVRIPINKLRLGFSDITVIDALSWMISGDKSLSKKIKKKYEVLPDVGKLAKEIKEKGIEKATENADPQVGTPVSPMLAQRIKSPKTMIEKMGKVAVEPKLDGLRIQIHYDRDKNFASAYTRNMNEVTWMFPEIVKIGDHVVADKVILDVEAIGLDPERKKLATFQITMTRRRKHEIGETALKVPIKFYVFDILLKNDENVMAKKYLDRRKILEETVKGTDLFELVDYVITEDPDKISNENEVKRAEGLEGIIVKRLDGKYVPGRTGNRWVKMKESEDSPGKLADTVDCVVMGYYTGKGKRTEFGLGGFLAGIVSGDKILTLTKVGTGLTDEQFRELYKRLNDLEANEKPKQYEVDKDLYPDVWTIPDLVVELAADDITVSTKHTAGYALRFPRLVRFRDDKNPEQATVIKEINELFETQ